MEIHQRRPRTSRVLSDCAEVPGIGCLAGERVRPARRATRRHRHRAEHADKDFVGELSEVIDPADVRWIWITHPDRDHTGGLWTLLEAAPSARLVTTFIGVGHHVDGVDGPDGPRLPAQPGPEAGPR